MSIVSNGKKFPTIREAAKRFGVTAKTVYEWIEKGIIPKPPTVQKGLKAVRVFPEDYMRDAQARIKRQEK